MNPPYPSDLEAKGWALDLDYERIEQSDTWAIAQPEQRPWLLMLWLVSWRQVPVASLPNNHRLIAARLGMPEKQFTSWADVLLSGWELADDGRLYHRTLTEHVLRMAEKRNKDRSRVAAYRSKSRINHNDVAACNALHARDYTVSSTPTPTPTPTKNTVSPPDGVSIEVWQQFKTLRTKLKAPITKIAMDGIKREADKAGYTLEQALVTMLERSWRGFNAEWVGKKEEDQMQNIMRGVI